MVFVRTVMPIALFIRIIDNVNFLTGFIVIPFVGDNAFVPVPVASIIDRHDLTGRQAYPRYFQCLGVDADSSGED